MSLCNVCRSIDFLRIPKLPASCNSYSARNKSSSLISVFKKHTAKEVADQSPGRIDEPLGQPFHQSFEELRATSTDCPICKVIEQDVSHFQTEFVEDQEDQVVWNSSKGPDYKMWLAKGVNDVSGFMVVSADIGNKTIVWVLSAVGFCVDDDDLLSNIVAGRKIDVDASSETSVQRAARWIQQCNAEHANTKCTVAEPPLPSRVLDVNNTASGKLSLKTQVGKVGKYAALNHVRDTDCQYNATISAKSDGYENDLNLDQLPKTFQDAITMTRKLGLQYLWIDAICIDQDDLPSWSGSTSQFVSIFSNAYITLSATGSSSNAAGMLHARSPPRYLPFSYTHNNNIHGIIYAFSLPKEPTLYPGNDRILHDEPLSQHGWALQERIFSPRILHFGSRQMYFECYGHSLGEDGFEMSGRLDTLYPDTQAPHRSQSNLRWQNIVDLYCRRILPRPSDKLPALSNLAAIIAEQTGDTYIAGLWRSHLVEGLIWQATGHASGKTSEPPEYRAPSWSWASIDGPFGMFCLGHGPDAGEWKDIAKVIDYAVTLKGGDPYGEVKDAWLNLRAPLEPLLLCDEEPKKQGQRMKTRNGNPRGTYCVFDTQARAKRARSLELQALLLTKGKLSRSQNWHYHGIVVARVLGKEGVYERMGKVVFDDETLGECEWMNDEKKSVDVLLV